MTTGARPLPRMSTHPPTDPACPIGNGTTPDADNTGLGSWGQLLQAARITAAEQDLDLRYLAVVEQPDGPDLSGIIGLRDGDLYDSAVAARLEAIKRGAIETGRPRQGRVDLTHDAGRRSYELTATPRRNERGEIVGVLSVAVEVTPLLHAHAQQPATPTPLAAVLEAATDAIISTGPDQRIVYVNPAAERMFGVPAAEAIGSAITRLVPSMDDMAPLRSLRARRASGEDFPVEISLSHSGGGEDRVSTMIIRDRTEHDRWQTQRLQSQTLDGIGRLAGGVAHDFNNLLTVILGYGELLRMRQRASTELDEINNAARRASQLTRQLLAFGRRQVLQVETVDLNGLIRGLHRMLRRSIGKDVELTTTMADEALWVVCDAGQMEQVLVNLVTRARDAMPAGGALHIATRIVDAEPRDAADPVTGTVELTVHDSGVGMTEDERVRVFEPFFTTNGDTGTGLGLATVHGIVTQSDGRIECESAPGQGTRFRVSLPLALPPSDVPPLPTGDVARGDETVLLVESEPLVRDLAARALREYGYAVLEAHDVASALRYVEHPRLAIVVADACVPGGGGDDLATEFGFRRPQLPVLLMTSHSGAAVHDPVDPARVLRKPFTPADLMARIRAVLDRGQAPPA